MKKKGLAASLLVIVYLLLVGAVGFSFLSADFLTEVKAAATKTVILDNGSFPKSSKSVSVPTGRRCFSRFSLPQFPS